MSMRRTALGGVFVLFLAATTMAQPNTTIQLPVFGVAIDANGVLSVKTFPDPRGLLKARQLAAARNALPAVVFKKSKLRKVSLIRLEQAVRAKLNAGQPIDGEMLYLAGLQLHG